ncbi:LOW QUALITY PROTEIN: low temperature requirement C protein [Geomicrobium sp. JCM 19055]|nr:LOW QUALITY PROTEIN: low temperature requirement C protein [Geomicrobium sp. JCM 19055]
MKKIIVTGDIISHHARTKLQERGVEIDAIAEIVYALQHPYAPNLTMAECIESVDAVLIKREIQHAVLVGIELDILAEEGRLSEPLLSLITGDEGLFGVDETIALGSVFGFGSIAVTSFGYLDKEKTGIIRELDRSTDQVNTFDDLVCSIAANASARLAHRLRDRDEAATTVVIRKPEDEELIG